MISQLLVIYHRYLDKFSELGSLISKQKYLIKQLIKWARNLGLPNLEGRGLFKKILLDPKRPEI